MNEAIGKVLGMAMAYGVSSLGLLLAYVNYRKRIVKAERVMSPRAWAVVGLTILSVAAGAAFVAALAARAETPSATPTSAAAELAAPVAQAEPAGAPAPTTAETARAVDRPRWPLVGIVVPGVIFLLATWITAALHRHFSSS